RHLDQHFGSRETGLIDAVAEKLKQDVTATVEAQATTLRSEVERGTKAAVAQNRDELVAELGQEQRNGLAATRQEITEVREEIVEMKQKISARLKDFVTSNDDAQNVHREKVEELHLQLGTVQTQLREFVDAKAQATFAAASKAAAEINDRVSRLEAEQHELLSKAKQEIVEQSTKEQNVDNKMMTIARRLREEVTHLVQQNIATEAEARQTGLADFKSKLGVYVKEN
ncbi:unnamed protein product, partial [Amoebophrya sp. A25]